MATNRLPITDEPEYAFELLAIANDPSEQITRRLLHEPMVVIRQLSLQHAEIG
jgi:hypothetical protein